MNDRHPMLADPGVVAAIAAEVRKAPPVSDTQADLLRRLAFPVPAATEHKAAS